MYQERILDAMRGVGGFRAWDGQSVVRGAGLVYHVLNRRVPPLFEEDYDYLAFEPVLRESLPRLDAPDLLAWFLMPNR